jgi:phage-related protein
MSQPSPEKYKKFAEENTEVPDEETAHLSASDGAENSKTHKFSAHEARKFIWTPSYMNKLKKIAENYHKSNGSLVLKFSMILLAFMAMNIN